MNKLLLKNKLNLVKDNNISIEIFNILKEDENFIYEIFNNGLIFDINLLNDSTIQNINNVLNKKIVYESYFIDKFNNDNVIINVMKRNKNISNMKFIKNV